MSFYLSNRGPYCGIDGNFHLEDGTLVRAISRRPGVQDSRLIEFGGFLQTQTQAVHEVIRILLENGATPRKNISETTFNSTALKLEVEVASIKAIAEVETAQQGAFDGKGRPTILFERHKFHTFTNGIYDATHPTISNVKSGGYGTFSIQYHKMTEAYLLEPEAALKSASWGRFQIMGFNFKDAGFESVENMVIAFSKSEDSHLEAVAAFILANKAMHKALRDKNWKEFARLYNGSNYRENDYDGKLKRAYEKFAPTHIPQPSPGVTLPPNSPRMLSIKPLG